MIENMLVLSDGEPPYLLAPAAGCRPDPRTSRHNPTGIPGSRMTRTSLRLQCLECLPAIPGPINQRARYDAWRISCGPNGLCDSDGDTHPPARCWIDKLRICAQTPGRVRQQPQAPTSGIYATLRL